MRTITQRGSASGSLFKTARNTGAAFAVLMAAVVAYPAASTHRIFPAAGRSR